MDSCADWVECDGHLGWNIFCMLVYGRSNISINTSIPVVYGISILTHMKKNYMQDFWWFMRSDARNMVADLSDRWISFEVLCQRFIWFLHLHCLSCPLVALISISCIYLLSCFVLNHYCLFVIHTCPELQCLVQDQFSEL